MKKGITSTLAFELEIQVSDVEQVIFTFKEKVNSEEYLLQKEYPSESVIFEDNKFKCKLTQEETDSLSNTFFVEAQINLSNKSVIKSDICKKIMPPTLWTTFVEDNESSGNEEIISLTFTDYVEGGGSGGTTNYNELSNKPRFNGIEWVGNKTDSDMGLATKTELNAKQNVITGGNGIDVTSDVVSVDLRNGESVLGFSNGKLKSDLSAYYTKTEIDTALGNKQNTLTVGNGIDITNDTVSVDLGTNPANLLIFESGKLELTPSLIFTDANIRSGLTQNYGGNDALASKDYTDTELAKKQDKLTAGTNITIDANNVISASGGGLSYTFTDGLKESSGTVGIDLASGSKLLIDTNHKLDVDLSSKQDTIDSTHKLSADLVDDTSATNKFVTSSDITAWNGKQDEIDSSHKLSSDLVDDTNNTNLFVTSSEKSTWNGKADNTTISTDTSSTTVSLTLADNHEYRYTQELSSLTLTMPSGDFIASIVFASGSTPTSMTYDSSIKWSGDDVTNGQFVPTEKTYNIVMWYDGININGVVRGV